jgi:hypothetical protein
MSFLRYRALGYTFLDYYQQWLVALVATAIAVWVMIIDVEIDSTIETLILALSPVIVGYVWPPTKERLRKRTDRSDSNNELSVDRDVFWAMVAALVIYVIAQVILVNTGAADLQLTDTTGTAETKETSLTATAKFLVAIVPVGMGALTPPA